MSSLTDFLNAINEYQVSYRSPTLPPLDVSSLYDLSPEKGNPAGECCGHWPEEWPNSRRAGVYAFLNEDLKVLYIGKASFKSMLGARLSSYCYYGSDRTCQLYHEWSSLPRYVVTVAVPQETRFEAAALEEYLIIKLQPSDNSTGIDR